MNLCRRITIIYLIFIVNYSFAERGPVHCADSLSATQASAQVNSAIASQLAEARAAKPESRIEIESVRHLDLRTYEEEYLSSILARHTSRRTRFVLCAAVVLKTLP